MSTTSGDVGVANVRLSNIISQFGGEGDFSEWLKKFELVASLQGIKSLDAFLPLFLTGNAFAIYDSLGPEDKKDYEKIKASLIRAFSYDEFTAYEAFVNRRYSIGEPVDVFLSDLRRLGKLVDSSVPENWIKCAFIAGLPQGVRAQLKAASSLSTMSLAEVVERARIVLALDDSLSSASSVGAFSAKMKGPVETRCRVCDVRGHFARNCPEKAKRLTCYLCGEKGHVVATCPQRPPKNE